jgi:hypothetical protein
MTILLLLLFIFITFPAILALYLIMQSWKSLTNDGEYKD